ncbi:hypothetical protein STEG23_018447 [Scotinomys teguina]
MDVMEVTTVCFLIRFKACLTQAWYWKSDQEPMSGKLIHGGNEAAVGSLPGTGKTFSKDVWKEGREKGYIKWSHASKILSILAFLSPPPFSIPKPTSSLVTSTHTVQPEPYNEASWFFTGTEYE